MHTQKEKKIKRKNPTTPKQTTNKQTNKKEFKESLTDLRSKLAIYPRLRVLSLTIWVMKPFEIQVQDRRNFMKHIKIHLSLSLGASLTSLTGKIAKALVWQTPWQLIGFWDMFKNSSTQFCICKLKPQILYQG